MINTMASIKQVFWGAISALIFVDVLFYLALRIWDDPGEGGVLMIFYVVLAWVFIIIYALSKLKTVDANIKGIKTISLVGVFLGVAYAGLWIGSKLVGW